MRANAIVALPGYAWMLDLLYGGKQSVAWAAAGSLPAGFERVEQLAELPSAPGRSFLVSLASRQGAASALTSFNALRSGRKRVVRRLLGAGLRTGLVQPLLRTKVDIGIRPAAITDKADLLTEHLRELCGVSGSEAARLVVAIGGGDGPYRKPVLQVFDAAGTPVGFVKVGWNEWTKDGVRAEAAALRACQTRSPKFGVPRLLGVSDWNDLTLMATAPLPDRVRGIGAAAPLPPASVLREISQLSEGGVGPLARSTWWRGVRSRIQQNVTDPPSRQALESMARRLEAGYGGARFEYGFCHGDFVPWNLAQADGQLYVWDWESSFPAAPLGFDAVHYHFQVAFVSRGLPLPEASALAARSARPALLDLGVPAAHCDLLAVLHLTELFLRHEEARHATSATDERFYPAITSVLGQRLADLAQTAPSVIGKAS
jgi:hypothetical protein